MDEELRELQRLAATDPETRFQYLGALVRTGMAREVERKARLGDPEAIALYLQLLDYQGILELEHLWICPFFFQAHDFRDIYEMWPYDQPFMPPIKYQLGMTLDDIDTYYEKIGYEYGPKYYAGRAAVPTQVVGAFVVDVFDLEAADSTSRSLQQTLAENLQEVGRQGTVATRQAAQDISRYAASLSKYYTLATASILILSRERGAHFPEAHELNLIARGQRATFSHLQDIHHDEIMKAYEGGPMPDQTTWWPHRQIRQLPTVIFPDRSSDAPYVIVIHIPTFRGFALAGGYRLLKSRVAEEEMYSAMRYNLQVDLGWLPSDNSQLPEWARGIPEEEFVAYWIAE